MDLTTLSKRTLFTLFLFILAWLKLPAQTQLTVDLKKKGFPSVRHITAYFSRILIMLLMVDFTPN